MDKKILLLEHLPSILNKIKAWVNSVLPGKATKAVAGIVKVGEGLDVTDGTISVNSDAVVGAALPTASSTVKGGVKIGANITIDADGAISTAANPTKLSQLTNDSGFQTSSQVTTIAQAQAKAVKDEILGGENISQTYDTIKEIATYIEAHEEVSTALNEAIGQKADASSVYTKTDADNTFAPVSAYATDAEVTAELTKVFGA